MRISPKTAWQICFKPSYQFDILVIVIALLSLAYLAYDYWQATRDYELVSSRYSAVVAIRKAQSMAIQLDKMERVAVACLNGDTVNEDGVDRPCKVGEFKNARAVF
jgi:hypothetical protein